MCARRVKPQLVMSSSLVPKSRMGSRNVGVSRSVFLLAVHHVGMLDSEKGCLDFMSFDKKHKRIGSRETTRDCDFWFSL
jgi:hypothetical protein